MELKFNFPEYCTDCPLINLAVQQRDVFIDIQTKEKVLVEPEVFCVHELVCAMWQEVLEQQKGEFKE